MSVSKSISLFIFCVYFFISFQTTKADDSVGAIPGSFEVGSSGSATYTLSIEVPPGLNGHQPSMALSYNSQSDNGPLGVGWDLSGLSSIMRCSTDVTHDGFIDPVDYDDNDQFCLDGQRLILLEGEHGHGNSVYTTEYGPKVKVQAWGTPTETVWFWSVYFEDGTISFYGADHLGQTVDSVVVK